MANRPWSADVNFAHLRVGTLGDLDSIPGDGFVHRGVGVEAAFQVEDVLEAGSLEGHGDVGTAIAVVADHDGLSVRVELCETPLQLGHGDKL